MGHKPKALTSQQLRRFVDDVTSTSAATKETIHAANDHPERKIDILDVWSGLARLNWKLVGRRFDPKHCSWKYKIVAQSISGRDLTIIVVPMRENRKKFLRIVTRW